MDVHLYDMQIYKMQIYKKVLRWIPNLLYPNKNVLIIIEK